MTAGSVTYSTDVIQVELKSQTHGKLTNAVIGGCCLSFCPKYFSAFVLLQATDQHETTILLINTAEINGLPSQTWLANSAALSLKAFRNIFRTAGAS